MKRLAGFVGAHSAEEMGHRFVCYDTVKKNTGNIFYDADRMEYAIKVYRREGRRYTVNSVVLACDDDNYYFACYDDKHEGTANYRLVLQF